MISVTVHTILDIKKVVGKREVQIPLPAGSTVRDLLNEMVDSWGDELSSLLFEPDTHELLSHIQIMVNGRGIVFLNHLDTELSDGDGVLILPPVGGG